MDVERMRPAVELVIEEAGQVLRQLPVLVNVVVEQAESEEATVTHSGLLTGL